MKKRQAEPTADKSSNDWQATQFANLIRYVPSGTYYARLHVAGKLIRKSLKTDVLSIAKLRLARFDKQERQRAEATEAAARGKMTVGDAIHNPPATFKENIHPCTVRRGDGHEKLDGAPRADDSRHDRAPGRLRAERPNAKSGEPVMQVRECQKGMDRAAKIVGMAPITHHDLAPVRAPLLPCRRRGLALHEQCKGNATEPPKPPKTQGCAEIRNGSFRAVQ